MKTIVVCGGGTAGHIMPIIALLPELKKHFQSITLIGNKDGMEKDICRKYNLDFIGISPVKFTRGKFLVNLKIPFKLSSSVKETKNILKKLNPSAVFSKGGYVALPTVIAARKLNIPVIAHECDMTLGLANKVSMPYVSKMITSFEETKKNKKTICIGTPLREQVFMGNKNKIINELNIKNKPTILILGGSSGAKIINDCIAECAEKLIDKYNIIHFTGKGKTFELNLNDYHQISYADNIEDFIAASDIVISRAGASTALELLALNKKVIFIPLPKGGSRGDQELNATFYEKNNFALKLEQDELTVQNLLKKIEKLQIAPLKRYYYDKKIPEKIVNTILSEIK